MQNKFLLYKVTLLVLLTFSAKAQVIKVSGSVEDTNSGPIPFATIQLKDLYQDEILAFTSSNQDGFFILDYQGEKKSNFIVLASCIGFKSDSVRLDGVNDGNKGFNIRIFLKSDTTLLKEVYVKPPDLIEVNEDTTRYKTAPFTTVSDRNIESVLSKMPGIEVDKDGSIFFKNRRISKVLLEGDDVTGNAYKRITKNLNPDLVVEVEAIEHYVEDSLLKGIIDSEDIVLNLKLRRNKGKIYGSIDVGLGTDSRRDLALNAISLFNGTKGFTHFNSGNLPTSISTDMLSMENNQSELSSDTRVLRHMAGAGNPFDRSSFTRKDILSSSVNGISRLGAKLKLNYNFFFGSDKSMDWNRNITTYFPPIEVHTEDVANRELRTIRANPSLKLDYLINDNARLLTYFSYLNEPTDFDVMQYSIFNKAFGDSISQIHNDKGRKFIGKLKFTKKVDKGTAYLLTMESANEHMGQKFNSMSNIYLQEPFSLSATNLSQSIDNRSIDVKLAAEALKRMGYSFLYFNLDIDARRYLYQSTLTDQREREKNLLSNYNEYRSLGFGALGRFVYDDRRIRIVGEVSPKLLKLQNFGKDSSMVFLQPLFSFGFKRTKYDNLSITYSYRNKQTSPKDYFQSYILTDFRNLSLGLDDIFWFNYHDISLLYNYTDIVNSFWEIGLGANATFNKRSILYSNLFVNAISISEKTSYKGNSSQEAFISVKKFVPQLSTKLRAFFGSNFSTFYSDISGVVGYFRNREDKVIAGASTGFKLPVNFNLEASVFLNRMLSEGKTVQQAKGVKTYIEARTNISETIHMVNSYTQYHINGATSNFINSEIRYLPKNSGFKFTLQGRNLLGEVELSNFYFGETMISEQVSGILGRYILLGVGYSIK